MGGLIVKSLNQRLLVVLAILLLVAGSEKKDQKKVIQLANAYFEDLKQRGEI